MVIHRLMDILACPICKHFPLQLLVFEKRKRKDVKIPERTCEEYCGYRESWIKDLPEKPCKECYAVEVVEGLLTCPECGRWYPIIEEIPHMLPDELRNRKDDLEFLKKYRDRIPERVLKEGRPFNLQG